MSFRSIVFVLLLLNLTGCQTLMTPEWRWETVQATGTPTARHEASFVEHLGKLYLIGGRRINPVDVFDPATNTWEQKSPTPIELHHFQAVSLGDAIYLIGAMTSGWPKEEPLANVMAYYPETDTFKTLHAIPKHRRRGGAAAVVHNEKIYLVGGITNGHLDGYQSWLDEYDPKTGRWRVLPSAKFARDHVQAATIDNKLYVFGGRTSRHRTGEVFSLPVQHGEIFNFDDEAWEPASEDLILPTLRAGNSLFAWDDEIVVGGGESHTQEVSHAENDAFNVSSRQWRRWPNSLVGRHGTGYAVTGGYVYVASGSAKRGGGPELTSVERLRLPSRVTTKTSKNDKSVLVHQQHHRVTLSFTGPHTSEQASPNPFTDYLLEVEFTLGDKLKKVRGFYAADGNAAHTSASAGNVWQVNFSPSELGLWKYKASLKQADGIALGENLRQAQLIDISNSEGQFRVVRSDKEAPDFRAQGRLVTKNGYFYHPASDQYWLKSGVNSPENLLGYYEIDGTYRTKVEAREGEAVATTELHRFPNHAKDWRMGDPTWANGKGKNIVGALNYLVSKGMNANYFLTMNIGGDGKDVWPFISHDDFTRFDVSKLAQWDLIFDHMQANGILLHVVLQETENETLFDQGDTGPQRKLYLNELVSRFSHHPALIWNLGEENGPQSWSPVAQNDDQRRAMSNYLKKIDPYNNPVFLHTHSEPHAKDDIVGPMLGHQAIDGLSFQVNLREQAHDEVIKWRARAKSAGKEWLITMDEIGEWHTAALPDSLDPNHDTLRRYALWGTLMAGSAGVEWYFGAKYPHNDLTSEDWRERDRLWDLSRYAHDFFMTYLPFWEMRPMDHLIEGNEHYVLAKEGRIYAVYMTEPEVTNLDLTRAEGEFSVNWYDPNYGGELKVGSVKAVAGGGEVSVGMPPLKKEALLGNDWVVLLRKVSN